MTKVWEQSTRTITHTTHGVVVMTRVATYQVAGRVDGAQECATPQRVSV